VAVGNADTRLSTASRLRLVTSDIRRAAAQYGVSRSRVLLHLVRLWRRYGFRPGEAHAVGLSNPRLTSEQLAAAISEAELLSIQARLNPVGLTGLAEDKAMFYTYCRGVDLPIPALFGVVDKPWGWTGDGVAVRDLGDWESFFARLPVDIVVKPTGTAFGLGVRVYERTPDGFRKVESGAIETAASLALALTTDRYGRLVIQERLRNHPEILRLTGTETLQTVRVNSLVTRQGDVVLGGCLFKIVRGENVVDNIHGGLTGNFLAGVGLKDGVLLAPLQYRASGIGLGPVSVHPLTGLRIEGFRLPWWKETLDVVVRASALFAPLRTFGWDVALTPSGPVLLEANLRWGSKNVLVTSEGEHSQVRELATLVALLRAESAG